MQEELDHLLQQYEKLVGEKLHLFTEMLSNMREISRNNESVICADEEIARIKTNMDFVKRDIFQKRRLLDDNTSIMDELRRELRELDDELLMKDQRIAEMEDAVKCKDCELQDLEDLIMHKDRVIGQMQQELLQAEDSRKKENEEKRKKEIEDLITRANQPRKPYIAIKGDPVDEMMAKHINECNYYVPVERMAEGHYMMGTKKVYAKIMNGKLIIRVGGGYMLIDEFLRHFESEFCSGAPLSASVQLQGGGEIQIEGRQGTPPRKSIGGGGSPARSGKSPNRNK
ncbi:hypothetical protein FGO68_gene11876 [Halteria grandinella]|uniref:GAR domain-containing protein n=1 Tax=Halteria grandinella TaxID=5974 RepID=A0A8J8NCQ0_HALGN|nr:hypothetical protein FGO68_gene11876 [Halteria grandinella]